MKNLFEVELVQKGVVDFDNYDAFVAKFKPKKTTDDCYTPPPVYDAVVDYVRGKYALDGKRIVRPFVPGGDYTAILYKDIDVVIDNPPFSIISKVITFYLAHNIPFFLFAPTLTLFNATKLKCTSIVCGVPVVYENGAIVNTSFCTNLFGNSSIIVDGELYNKLNAINSPKKKTIKKISFPDIVTSASRLVKIANSGNVLTIENKDAYYTINLDCGYHIFGGGVILSRAAAAEKAAAEKAAAEKAAAEKAFDVTLSKRELTLFGE